MNALHKRITFSEPPEADASGGFSSSKNFQYALVSGIIKETGVYLWNNGEKTQEAK